jgi:hypothetical protein
MRLKTLPYPLRKLSLTELPCVQESLFREINVLHRRHVLRWRLADTRGDNDGVGFEDDTIIYEFIDGEGLRMLARATQRRRRC